MKRRIRLPYSRQRQMKDEKVTRLYDQAFQEEEVLTENRKLAEEMTHLAADMEGKEEW